MRHPVPRSPICCGVEGSGIAVASAFTAIGWCIDRLDTDLSPRSKVALSGLLLTIALELAGGRKGDVVYRGLGEGKDIVDGLRARNPSAGNSPSSHVAGQKDSQWISTTKDPDIAVDKYGKYSVVEIDLKKVRSEVVDASGGSVPGSKSPRVQNYAKKDQEVLIKGEVPADAIRRIK